MEKTLFFLFWHIFEFFSSYFCKHFFDFFWWFFVTKNGITSQPFFQIRSMTPHFFCFSKLYKMDLVLVKNSKFKKSSGVATILISFLKFFPWRTCRKFGTDPKNKLFCNLWDKMYEVRKWPYNKILGESLLVFPQPKMLSVLMEVGSYNLTEKKILEEWTSRTGWFYFLRCTTKDLIDRLTINWEFCWKKNVRLAVIRTLI